MDENRQGMDGKDILNRMLSEEYSFSLPDGESGLSPEGNLGLLAAGYKGIVAWRKIKEAKNFRNGNEIITDQHIKAD
jgi:hypothetical protein